MTTFLATYIMPLVEVADFFQFCIIALFVL